MVFWGVCAGTYKKKNPNKKTRAPTYTIHKNKLKMDKRLKSNL